MSSVNVNFEDLIRFKQTLDKNAANFEEIRKQIGDTITNITNTDWQDPKSEQFKNMFFTQSDNDITALVVTMNTPFSSPPIVGIFAGKPRQSVA